jgi:hypothetical protein
LFDEQRTLVCAALSAIPWRHEKSFDTRHATAPLGVLVGTGHSSVVRTGPFVLKTMPNQPMT